LKFAIASKLLPDGLFDPRKYYLGENATCLNVLSSKVHYLSRNLVYKYHILWYLKYSPTIFPGSWVSDFWALAVKLWAQEAGLMKKA